MSTMDMALITYKGNMAPLSPGAKIKLQSEINRGKERITEIEAGWYPLVWGQNLKGHNVNLLLCAGIERFMPPTLRGILHQCGIQLISNVTGSVQEVIELWRSGRLIIPETFESKPQINLEKRQAG